MLSSGTDGEELERKELQLNSTQAAKLDCSKVSLYDLSQEQVQSVAWRKLRLRRVLSHSLQLITKASKNGAKQKSESFRFEITSARKAMAAQQGPTEISTAIPSRVKTVNCYSALQLV